MWGVWNFVAWHPWSFLASSGVVGGLFGVDSFLPKMGFLQKMIAGSSVPPASTFWLVGLNFGRGGAGFIFGLGDVVGWY